MNTITQPKVSSFWKKPKFWLMIIGGLIASYIASMAFLFILVGIIIVLFSSGIILGLVLLGSSIDYEGVQPNVLDMTLEESQEIYQKSMNLDIKTVLPNKADQVVGKDLNEGFWGAFWLKYPTPENYEQTLLAHKGHSKEDTILDQGFFRTNCDFLSLEFDEVKSSDQVDTIALSCYEGFIFPYSHQIMIDHKNQEVWHLSEEVRE